MEPNILFLSLPCVLVFPSATDGAFHGNAGPNDTVVDDTELADAPKGVMVLVSHGVCGGVGVATTIIKKGKEEGSNAIANSSMTPVVGHSRKLEA